MIRVLIADDSAFMRTVIADALQEEAEIDIVGRASNGVEAINIAEKERPDVVLMDVQMPRMNGLEATRHLVGEGKVNPSLVIFSGMTKEDADLVLECLNAGAFSCVHKPSGTLSMSIDSVKKELIQEIKAAARAPTKLLKRTAKRKGKVRRNRRMDKYPLVVIGASTGGPPILQQIFEELDPDISLAILVVQHMPAYFTASLAQRLDSVADIKVSEGQEGDLIKHDTALVAPGDFHMVLKHEGGFPIASLNKDPEVHSLRPSIDVTMKSVAADYPGDLLHGIILSGMGSDGTEGMINIKNAGGHTVAQSPDTCVVDSMPETAIGCDAVDKVLDPSAIAKYINDIVD